MDTTITPEPETAVAPPGVARVGWVDFAKGVGIVLVVFGHVWRGLANGGVAIAPTLFEGVDRFVYLFHMPLFFFLSGLFLAKALGNRSLGAYAGLRAEQLIYPFFVWSYLSAGFRLLAGGSASRGGLSLRDALLYPFEANDIYWFLWALFLIQICLAALDRVPASVRRIALAALIAASVAATATGTALPVIGSALHYLPFVALGRALGTSLGASAAVRPVGSRAGWLGAVLFLAAEGGALAFGLQGLGALAAAVVAVIGFSLALAALFDAASGTRAVRALAALGALSLPIYLAHVIAASGARVIALRLGITEWGPHVVIGCAAGLVGPLVLVWVANRLGLAPLLGFARFPAFTRRRLVHE
ncbi:acyltransferase family protein [Methylobacterium aerolatum]|uniref:Fucose 4-O-acetylase-like acetyltransferase n=1 Tax=Methylobacterium aerolatum TaxID=418708 RepID=A0ABU0HWY5_9HYPH|nr:acyltransferase family protein [Methylobacterium aerolatum]MDQ0446858.1 fucose 4-O-acetylase-like acetyltransferase [Methylobacterium aerolatum]